MKHFLFLFFLILFCLFNFNDSFAQDNAIDSLKTQLQLHTRKDTTRVNLLIDIASAYFRIDLDSTRTYLEKAKSLSTNLDDIKGKANAFRLLARLENIKSDFTKSLDFLQLSLTNYKLINNQEGAARVYIGMGINYYNLSRFEEAMTAYQQASKIYQLLRNKRGIATCQINIAIVYEELGKYDQSISRYKQALELSNQIGDDEGVAYVNTNLGGIHQVQGNYPLALICFYKALSFREKVSDYEGLTYTLHSLGEVNLAMQKYDKALTFFEKSLKHAVQIGDKNNIVSNNSNIGDIYLTKTDYANALKHYTSSLHISEEINNLKQIATVKNKIGKVHLLLKSPLFARSYFTEAMQISQQTGNQRILANSLMGIAETYMYNKKYKIAISYIQKSKKIADDLLLLPVQQKAARFLYTIYKKTKNYQKSLDYHEIYKRLSDSILNKENIEKITALEYEYKYEQELSKAADRELKLTQTVETTAQNLEKSQRNVLISIIIFLGCVLMLGSIIFFLKLRHANAKNQNIVIEQKLLRSQMTPHFIFNSLSVLQGMILGKEDKKSVTYLSKFSKLLRIILENSRDKTVLLSEELKAIENYLELYHLEHESYQYTIQVDTTIDIHQFKIPPMLIQPFVENAIEHAFIGHKGVKKIDITLSMVGKKLQCIIIDNGIGINTTLTNKHTSKNSVSTTITKERLSILSKDYNMKGTIEIKDRSITNEKGTEVLLTIPYKLVEL